MSKLVITNAEKNNLTVSNFRLQPLITWLHSLNFITMAIICLLGLKIYRALIFLYKWLFPSTSVSEYPLILVLGPKNEIVQGIIFQLSQKFKAEVIICQDLNGNSNEELIPKKKSRKSLVICSHETFNRREDITELKTRVEKTFGVVDILVVSQVEKTAHDNSTHSFLNHLNKELLVQFWTVMAFLPGMLRRNRGHILSVALGKTSLINTGIMRSIHEEILQCDTDVKLTLVERNAILGSDYLPLLSPSVLASLIVRSMWNSNAVVKVPSLPCYLIILPVLLLNFLLKPVAKVITYASARNS